MTRGNRPPFCLPPPLCTRTHSSALYPLPVSPLSSACPSPSELLHCEDFLDGEGHSRVIVMQQGSAAWVDVNETTLSDEKLLWYVLKDKSPHSEKTILKVFNFFHHAVLEYCFSLDAEGSFLVFLQMDASLPAWRRLMLSSVPLTLSMVH